MKKIAILALTLVVALGALGIGYAAWTDQVVINGTVSTGSLDLNVVNWSNTWVWKVPGTAYPGEIYVAHQWETDPTNDQAPAGAITSNLWPDGNMHYELAIADSDNDGDDAVLITFANLFPDIDFTADFLMRYDGTIPAKVWLDQIVCSNEALSQYMTVKYYTSNAAGEYLQPIEGALQMHDGDYAIVAITINIPEDNELMNLSGTIQGTINAIQWNEYVEPVA